MPSSAFTSQRTQAYIAGLDWQQAWLKEEPFCSRGTYSFSGSAWAEMNVWQPMWLAHLYREDFNIRFLDVKGLALQHGGMGDALIEPPFDVMMGWRI